MVHRKFILTWWAGMVRDSFGPVSIFHVARFGVLRQAVRCVKVEGSRWDTTFTHARCEAFPLVQLLNYRPTRGFLVSKGLTDLGVVDVG